MNKHHISTYYDEADDEDFILLGSRFMKAAKAQSKHRGLRAYREREDNWHNRKARSEQQRIRAH